MAFILIVETSGNQPYIFETNKLRENRGASQLAHEVGTLWLVDALTKVVDISDPGEVRFEQDGLEVITSASGRAIVALADNSRARLVAAELTGRALRQAPGLTVASGISGEFEWATPGALANAVKDADHQLGQARTVGGGQPRFLRLPVVADCGTSPYPAEYVAAGKDGGPRSRVAYAKRRAAESAAQRMKNVAADQRIKAKLDDLEDLDDSDGENWIAVIHADGNGIGERFIALNQAGMGLSSRAYADSIRQLSEQLERCSRAAFRQALAPLEPDRHRELPIVPIIVGGDDVTVITRGQEAIAFTVELLRAYENATREAELAGGPASACAGIAVIKPHFPFSIAYRLAESLTASAKQVKQRYPDDPVSAFDFHVQFDSGSSDLDAIREQLRPAANIVLHARPCIVTPSERVSGRDGWLDFHHVNRLLDRVDRLGTAQQDGGAVPRTQLIALREALRLGPAAAAARYKLLRSERLTEILDGSLFHNVDGEDVTQLLDILDVYGLTQKPTAIETAHA